MEIEDIHPLREKASIADVLPFLKPCFKKRKDFKNALRESFLEELGIKIPKGDKEITDNPFLLLGYGINAQFDIMLSMVYMFICITIFCIPVYYVYKNNPSRAL
jgi:hypothetical protein